MSKIKCEVIVDVSTNSGREKANDVLHSDSTSNTRIRISQVSFEVHRFDRSVVAEREQLPSIPSYAITIHPSPGMTLSQVAIDFQYASHWKPHGMAYVALSRCRSAADIWVTVLRRSHISVSRRAKKSVKELWKLHVHMSSRIWGALTHSCLDLSFEDTKPVAYNANESREPKQSYSSTFEKNLSSSVILEES